MDDIEKEVMNDDTDIAPSMAVQKIEQSFHIRPIQESRARARTPGNVKQ